MLAFSCFLKVTAAAINTAISMPIQARAVCQPGTLLTVGVTFATGAFLVAALTTGATGAGAGAGAAATGAAATGAEKL